MSKVAFDLIGAEPASNGVINHGGGEYVKTVFDFYYENNIQEIHVIISGKDQKIIQFLQNYHVIVHQCPDSESLVALLMEFKFNCLFCGLYVGQYKSVSFPKSTRLVLTEHGLRGIEVKFDKHFLKTEKKKLNNFIKMSLSKFFPRFYLKLKKKKYQPEFEITNNFNLVTVSHHSKFSIEYFFPSLKGNVFVGYSPMKVSEGTTNDGLLKELKLEKEKYILMINANRGEKNCLRAMEAIFELYQKNSIPLDFKIVMTGVTYDKPFKKYENMKLVTLGYVGSILLETLYANAHMFLYPTTNEGFGYPPLEAMKYNTFVAASAICSIPEVCGDAVLYFNPYDIAEIQNRVLQSFDKQIRIDYISRMNARMSYIEKKQVDGLIKLSNLLNGEETE